MNKVKMNGLTSKFACALLSTTAVGMIMTASPASAQDACTTLADGTVVCDDPTTGDLDLFLDGDINVGAAGDDAYDNLDEKIASTTPSDADAQAATDDVTAAQAAADQVAADQAAVAAALTQDNVDAQVAAADAVAAQAAADAAAADAAGAATVATTAFDTAADDLTVANVALGDANTTLATANTAVTDARTTFDANQNQANLDALNAALADQAAAQTAANTASDAAGTALIASNTAAADLLAAQTAATAATAAAATAATATAAADTALQTSLAGNADFVDAITTAGFTADTTGLDALNTAGATEAAALAAAIEFEDNLDNVANTFIRAQEVLVPAAENANPAIAAASQALLGDERAEETNSEVEVIAALVDHEGRITTNTEGLAAEVIARTDADTAIGVRIDDETTARIAGDANLLGVLTDETNARIAADTAISSRMDAVDSRLAGIDTRLDRFDDRISSATATAIALGGAGFLPDMKFNLAVNVGFYEGAQAVSASVGYRVTDNVAVTAGVAGGINKGGKVGGRVGMIFGF